MFEAGGGEGGRTGGGQLSQQGSPGLGGSLDEPVGAYIPCLGSQRPPCYFAVGGTWAAVTRSLEVGAGTCRVGEVMSSAEVGSVTWVHPVKLTWGWA